MAPPGYAVLEHNPEHKHLLLNPGGHPGACGAGEYVLEGIYMGNPHWPILAPFGCHLPLLAQREAVLSQTRIADVTGC